MGVGVAAVAAAAAAAVGTSRCDNCDKSRQSVVPKNTARIFPSLLFFFLPSLPR